MPVYEYRCQDCRRLVRLVFTFSEYGKVTPVCTYCESKNLTRRIGRIVVAKSEDARMDTLMDDSALAGLDEEDPRSLGKFMRKMSREMGEDMGDEFNEVVDRLEKGESPETIEQSMPDLGMNDNSFSGGDF
ncbi:MAG: zinc ribbon domain-containing protein [Anaerolineae bacterium]|nr:zinc ribbon domain-containing protein [Anaerolineae bacterium]